MKKSIIAIICLLSLIFTFAGNGIIVYAQNSKDETEEVSTTTSEKKIPISKVEVAQINFLQNSDHGYLPSPRCRNGISILRKKTKKTLPLARKSKGEYCVKAQIFKIQDATRKYTTSDSASTRVVIRGDAITAGSRPTFFAKMGSVAPKSFAQIMVSARESATTRATV